MTAGGGGGADVGRGLAKLRLNIVRGGGAPSAAAVGRRGAAAAAARRRRAQRERDAATIGAADRSSG